MTQHFPVTSEHLKAYYAMEGAGRTAHQDAHAPAFERYALMVESAPGPRTRIRVKRVWHPATTYSIFVAGEEHEATIDRRWPLALQLKRFDYWLALAQGWEDPSHTPHSLRVYTGRKKPEENK